MDNGIEHKFTKLSYLCKYVLILVVVDNGIVPASEYTTDEELES